MDAARQETPADLSQMQKRWMEYPQASLARCREEQKKCVDYVLAGGTDTEAAMEGLADWLMEEAILIQEHDAGK